MKLIEQFHQRIEYLRSFPCGGQISCFGKRSALLPELFAYPQLLQEGIDGLYSFGRTYPAGNTLFQTHQRPDRCGSCLLNALRHIGLVKRFDY